MGGGDRRLRGAWRSALARCCWYRWTPNVDAPGCWPMWHGSPGCRSTVRAARLRDGSTAVTIALLVVDLYRGRAGRRPSDRTADIGAEIQAAQPEDIMVCVGAPMTDRAVGAVLGYFAEQVTGFGTQRIGLTSPNRRVVPLTRDYQYAAAQFGSYARPADQQGDSARFTAPVTYSDYAASVEDVLALCLDRLPVVRQGDGAAAFADLRRPGIAARSRRHPTHAVHRRPVRRIWRPRPVCRSTCC